MRTFHLVLLAAGLCAFGAEQIEATCSWNDTLSANGKCYKYFEDAKTWEEAKKHCESLQGGGMLAKFDTDAEFLKLNYSTTDAYWIGANDIETEGQFRWTDGSAANLNDISIRRLAENLNCVIFYGVDKHFYDNFCDFQFPFMCMEHSDTANQPSDLVSTTPTIQQPTCTPVVDLIYVLDSSSSIGPKNFKKQISFAIDLASNLKIVLQDFLVSAVVFSSDPHKYFDLKDHLSIVDLSKNLSAIQYKGHKTRTDKALDLILNDGMFTPDAGSRVNSSRTVIVITDGKSDNSTKTQQAAARIKDQGITINAVGIGDAVESELLAIASDASNVFKADSVDALKQIVTSVTQQACPPILFGAV